MTKRRRNLLIALGAFLALAIFLWWDIQLGLPSLEELESPHPEIATRIISTDVGDSKKLKEVRDKTRITLIQLIIPSASLQVSCESAPFP